MCIAPSLVGSRQLGCIAPSLVVPTWGSVGHSVANATSSYLTLDEVCDRNAAMKHSLHSKDSRALCVFVPVLVLAAMLGCSDDGTIHVDPDGPPLDMNKLVRACAILSGCQGDEVPECVFDLMYRGTAAQVDCVLAATLSDCTSANACVGLMRSTDPNCTAGCLDADTLVSCAGSLRTEIECASSIESLGPSCIGGTQSACGIGACSSDTITCNGTVASRCISGVANEYDCARFGMECAQDRGCVGAAVGPCVAAPGCDGNFIVECDAGVERRTDCSAQLPGGTCGVVVNHIVGCVLGQQCDALQTVDSCIGTTLQSCVAGTPMSVDCTSVGGTSCGYSGPHARCMP